MLREKIFHGKLQQKLLVKCWNHHHVVLRQTEVQHDPALWAEWYKNSPERRSSTACSHMSVKPTEHLLYIQTPPGCFFGGRPDVNPVLCAAAGASLWSSPPRPWGSTRSATTPRRCPWAGAGSGSRPRTTSCGCCWPGRSGSSWPTSPCPSSTSWSRGTSTPRWDTDGVVHLDSRHTRAAADDYFCGWSICRLLPWLYSYCLVH